MKRDRVRLRVPALLLAAVAGLIAVPAAAPGPDKPVRVPAVELHSAAALHPDGRTLGVTVLAKCPEGWTVVEAVVAVSQGGVSGQGSFPLTCIGSFRSFTVEIPASGGTFVLGSAQATASILIKRGRTQRVDDSAAVDVQPTVFADIAGTAVLQGSGTARIDVTVACPVGVTPQQSSVGITQGNSFGGGPYLPICDGGLHTFTVTVTASQGSFAPGPARALTFAVIEFNGIGIAGVDDTPIELVSG